LKYKNNLSCTLVVGSIRFEPHGMIDINEARLGEENINLLKEAIDNKFISKIYDEDVGEVKEEKGETIVVGNVDDNYINLFNLHWRVFEKEIEKIDDVNIILELEQYAIETDKSSAYKKILYNRKLALQRDDG
jgi:hypothetical protein